jgi:hypothetical protein
LVIAVLIRRDDQRPHPPAMEYLLGVRAALV